MHRTLRTVILDGCRYRLILPRETETRYQTHAKAKIRGSLAVQINRILIFFARRRARSNGSSQTPHTPPLDSARDPPQPRLRPRPHDFHHSPNSFEANGRTPTHQYRGSFTTVSKANRKQETQLQATVGLAQDKRRNLCPFGFEAQPTGSTVSPHQPSPWKPINTSTAVLVQPPLPRC